MYKKRLVFLVLMCCCSTSFAARTLAPVVDLNNSSAQEVSQNGGEGVISHQNEPMDQRVLRLERQMANMTDMNVASKLETMQQEMQKLQGQIEVQNHELAQLKDQLRSFYQDLDQRLARIKADSSSLPAKGVATVDNSQPDTASDTNTTDSSASNKSKELQSYETAFNQLNKKEYDKAIDGFKGFIKDYPSSSYSVNAHYWMGEIYYLKGKPEQANKEFQTIITNFPENPKVADATLKVALIAMDAGNYTKAKQHFTKVQKQFPGTTAAKIATLRLKELKQKS